MLTGNRTIKIILVLSLVLIATSAYATTRTAASCSQADVQSAINSASAGDTVMVPAGSFVDCTWSVNVALKKAITLQGAGINLTNIAIPANDMFTITKQAAGIIRVQGFSFSMTGTNTSTHPIVIGGNWLGTQPVIFQNNTFTISHNSMFSIFVAGGVIFSHNTFTGGWNDFAFTIKDPHDQSWLMADSMGNRDTDGIMNVYIEDNTFNGMSNGMVDCDDNCRMVLRHNRFVNSGGYNSHGYDTSPYGTRHFEIYENSFTFPDKTCDQGLTSLSNLGFYIWVRGASGVIYNNSMENITSTCWGDVSEIKLANRNPEPGGLPSNTCTTATYPTRHQLGQNNNGTSDFTDPIWIWGNTSKTTGPDGYYIDVSAGWMWGNQCNFDWNTFFQWGRDARNTSLTLPITLPSAGGHVEGIGGTAKPGYTPYMYPHPLTAKSSDATPPTVSISIRPIP